MDNNIYWKNAIKFKEIIEDNVRTIFNVYGNELILRIEEMNLLSSKNNCIESSTAIGFILEEFIISKLEIFTTSSNNKFKINRNENGTTTTSYDCFSMFNNEKYLINIKADKGNNNAIAAITKLYNDYNDDEFIKHYLVLKIKYKCDYGKNINSLNVKKIIINGIESFYLEEINFKNGHKQDNRNWSEKFNRNSGRLQVSNKFYNENKMNVDLISYKETCNMLFEIYKQNK